MRQARLKPDYRDTWHHCYNRVAGTCEDRPFGDVEKEQFVRILRRVADFYAVRIVAYQVMSNHFHLLLQAPEEPPSAEETARRFAAFHGGRRTLAPGSPLCEQWRARLRDVSWCLRHLQHLYTAWYNRTRPVRRRGPLWAGRFKNTVLDTGYALWACWTYIERNPVRAGMVADPADYRFSSYGHWVQTGHHPFPEAFAQHLKPSLPLRYQEAEDGAILRALREEFARLAAEEAKAPAAEVDAAIVAAGREPAFTLTARRRVRHWVDGLVIGSEIFVRETMRRVRTEAEVARHRLATAEAAETEAVPVCCWRRLRVARN
jgi:REP element-mobilizing transposase RayT